MTVPADAKQPKDHLKPAAQREAEGTETVTIEWHGSTIELPATVDDWDLDALEAFESGQAITAIRGLLGSERYDELRKELRKKLGRKLRVGDLKPLGDEIARIYGFDSAGG